MPTVPTQDNFNTRPSTTASFRFSPERAPDAGRVAGRQMEETGQSMQRAGQQQTQAQLEILQEANQLRVDDALNEAREEALRLQYDPEEGFTNLKGYDALNRPKNQPLEAEYASKLEEHLSEVAGSLGNEDQQMRFKEQSTALLARFREGLIQYEGEQFQEYSKSVRRGTIANRTQEISLNYRSQDIVDDALVSIEASAKDLARQEGKAASEGEALARDALSKAHMVVIETALQKEDSVYADEYFKKNARNMVSDDILKVNAVLGEQLDTKIAVGVVGEVMAEQTSNFVTPDSERAFNIALNTESGGKQFGGAGSVAGADEPTTSPAGAIGVAQVMPDTGPEAAKLAGMDWDEERFRNDPEYNRALGKAYFDKQLKDFDGSLAQAYAAYNAGPGATRGAISAARNDPDGKSWLEFLPEETQKYVDKNMSAFGAGKGTNKRPTLLEVKNRVREQIGTDSPRRLKLALAEAEAQYDTITKSIEQQEEQIVADAMRELVDNGGDYSALPTLMRSAIPPQRIGKVIDFARKLQKGDNTTNLALYNQLTEDPQMLANLTDDQFFALRDELSDTDYKHFSKQRADIRNGNQPDGQNPGSLNTSAIKTAVDNRLIQMGMRPTASFDKDGEPQGDTVRVGGIRKLVNEAILASQNATGKKMNDAEVEQFIDKLFSERTTYEQFWGSPEGPVLGMKFSDIPKQIQKDMRASFKRRGIEPSEQELLEAYQRQVFFTRAQKADKGSY